MRARPVIALITDFGLIDHYVGVMKGVIAGVCPDALTIDITHGVPPQDIRTAAFELAAACRFFPDLTVFLAVVDPGVGTARRAVAARIDDRFFVGPDNGVFDLVLQAGSGSQAVVLDRPQFARAPVSATFEGRDRFAPAAAWLGAGTALEDLGTTTELTMRLSWAEPHMEDECAVGEVIHIDRFGNLVTNIDRTIRVRLPGASEVAIAGHPPARLVRTYGEGGHGELIALFGSSDRLELAIAGGSAADTLGIGRGGQVRLSRRA